MASPNIARERLVAGRYELGEEIARGGMGAVFRSRDGNLDRDLAVKVMLADPLDRPDLVRRFLTEARLTASLQHPGIVPVHEVGTTPDGSPFFAMKLVAGVTLAHRIAERASPTDGLPALVEVFLQVCQAVAYAHSRCLVHRDLKPQNIMVGAFGEVQVMDWGLAREFSTLGATIPRPAGPHPDIDDSLPDTIPPQNASASTTTNGLRTQPGAAIGTPAYMAPEQARGECEATTPRLDVFALGAILCEILTGSPPFGTGSAEVVRTRAARELLGPAREMLAACGADHELVTICERCLAADPTSRPGDGAAVAELIAQYRAGVEERLRSAETERAASQARIIEQKKRRKVQAALVSMLALLLAGVVAFTWWEDRQATARRQLAERNAASLSDLLDRAELGLRVGDETVAASAMSEIDRRSGEKGGEALQIRIEWCRYELDLLRALQRIDDASHTLVDGKRRGPEAVRAEWAATFQQFEIVRSGDSPERAAERIARFQARDTVLRSLHIWLANGAGPELPEILRIADPDPYREMARRAIQSGSSDRVNEAVLRPDIIDQPVWFVSALAHSRLVAPEGQYELLTIALKTRPDDFNLLMALGSLVVPNAGRHNLAERIAWLRAAVAIRTTNAVAWNNLGTSLDDWGDWAGAYECYRLAIQCDPNFAMPRYNLALALAEFGDTDLAIDFFRTSLRLDPGYARAHYTLANHLITRKDYDLAEQHCREAIRLDGSDPKAFNNLGSVLQRKGLLDGALIAYETAVLLDPDYALAYRNIGSVHFTRQDFPVAITMLRKSVHLKNNDPLTHAYLARALALVGEGDEAVAEGTAAVTLDASDPNTHFALGFALRRAGRKADAIIAYREAIHLGSMDPAARLNLANLLYETGRLDDAIAQYKAYLMLNPTDAPVTCDLGRTYGDRKMWNEAIACYREAIRLDPRLSVPHYNIGVAYSEVGDKDAALAEYLLAIRLNPKDARAHNNLGVILMRKADWEGAIIHFQEAVRLNPSYLNALKNLAVASNEVDNMDLAIESAQRATRLDPKDQQMQRFLEILEKEKAERERYPHRAPQPREKQE